jgi:hypothetical protein
MRDGYKVRFCYDLWCGDMAFKNSFLVSLGIACANDTYVATHVEFSGGAIYWNVSFARAAHDWEVDTFTLYFMNEMGRERQVVVGPFQKRVVWC